jgi:uncharacterized protein (DUF1778 family)
MKSKVSKSVTVKSRTPKTPKLDAWLKAAGIRLSGYDKGMIHAAAKLTGTSEIQFLERAIIEHMEDVVAHFQSEKAVAK